MEKELKGLQQELSCLLSVTKKIIVNMKRQSARISPLVSLYKTQKQSNGILSDPSLKDLQFKDIQEYSNLLNKQFLGHLEQMYNEHLKNKLNLEKLVNEQKAKPGEDYTSRADAFKKIVRQFQATFLELWNDQHFLVLNYRLDISVKELQRWTAISQAYKTKPEDIKSTVQNLFK